MMTLLSFFGGTAFRLIFGQVMDWLNKRQDHLHEMDLMRLQNELEGSRHERDCARIKLQSDLNVREVQVVSEANIAKGEMDAFIEAVKATAVKTGLPFVDGWNACIRPAGATIALVVWVVSMAVATALSDFDKELIAAFLGIFIGDRIHKGIGK
jgi:hypothetical protein